MTSPLPVNAGVAQLVEYHLAMVAVDSSSLFARSNFKETLPDSGGVSFVSSGGKIRLLSGRPRLITRVSMQTIGERLLEARQRRGVSIREAAEATKVRGDYLTAMENNQFDSIPLADVYRRGFLKIYARFLRLDGERVVGDFNALLSARNPGAPRSRRATDIEVPVRGVDGRESDVLDDFSSGAIEVAVRPENRRKTIIMVGGASLGLIILVWALMPSRQGAQSPKDEASSGAPAATVVDGEVIFTSQDTRAINLTVTRKSDGQVIYTKTIEPGASVTMRAEGEVVASASSNKLVFSVNGGKPVSFVPGYTRATLNVPAKSR
jgi:cytoskeleton protein RodZ